MKSRVVYRNSTPSLAALADAIGITVVNLSVLKNNRARAVRFSTLTAICEALQCAPGDVFGLADDGPASA